MVHFQTMAYLQWRMGSGSRSVVKAVCTELSFDLLALVARASFPKIL